MSPSFMCYHFTKREREYDLRDQNIVTLPNLKTNTYGRKSFRYCGAHVWNSARTHIRSAPTMKSFKDRVNHVWVHRVTGRYKSPQVPFE